MIGGGSVSDAPIEEMEGPIDANLPPSDENDRPLDKPAREGDRESSPVSGSGAFDDRTLALREALPLASNWVENAARILGLVRRVLEDAVAPAHLGKIGFDAMRRHFHTDRSVTAVSELQAASLIEQNFLAIKRYLAMHDSIFTCVDDEVAAANTRGYFGSEFIVPAYDYSHKSISFTGDFEKLGEKCRAAVIVHQLAHFIDARIRDHGSQGPAYERLDFETALVNVHAYPNFAINVSPPFLDERFGMMWPEV